MKIDLKWLMIPASPFVVVWFVEVLYRYAGGGETDPAFLTMAGLLGGLLPAIIICCIMDSEKIKWTIRIGGKDE